MTAAVGVVVPAYRPDVDRLAEYVAALHDALDDATIRVELDAAAETVTAALERLPVDLHAVPERRGKGAAITAGFEALDAEVLAFADADGSTPATDFANIVAPVREGSADIAVGSRRHPEATVATHQTFARRFMGDGFAWLARRLLDVGLYDYQCGAKAITAESWNRVREHLYEPGFAWDVELVAIAGALDLTVAEIPIEWHDRPGSTVSPVRDSVRLFQALLSARHRAKQLTNDRLHGAVAAARTGPTALIDRDD
ncbi:glycosyltransferase [Halobacteriales archaeon Cl-PHB]